MPTVATSMFLDAAKEVMVLTDELADLSLSGIPPITSLESLNDR